jgi:long-chain acyl-CoA synthetase
LAVTKQSEAIDLAEIATGLPRRIHEVVDRHVVESPDRIALIEDGSASTYHELNQSVAEVAAALGALGVRPGDRMMIVSENCIAISALLLAASRIDAWAIVGSPSQQIRSGGAAKAIAEEQITIVSGVPATYQRALADGRSPRGVRGV